MSQSKKLAESLVDSLIKDGRLQPQLRDEAVFEAHAEITRSMRGLISKTLIQRVAKSMTRSMIETAV